MSSPQERLLLFLARKSWRFARHTSFRVHLDTETGPVAIPIHRAPPLV